jgi:hypothetical protein
VSERDGSKYQHQVVSYVLSKKSTRVSDSFRCAGLWHAADGGGCPHCAARALLKEDRGHLRRGHATLLQEAGVRWRMAAALRMVFVTLGQVCAGWSVYEQAIGGMPG